MECPKLCAKGDLQSCYFHARALSTGMGLPLDMSRAIEMFRVGCDAGHADSCSALALNSLPETGPRTDEQFLAVEPLFTRGCKLGSSKACNNLGSFYRKRSLGRTGESLGYFIRSCELGAGGARTGCVEAADTLRDGDWGESKDLRRAAELYRRSCLLGGFGECASATALGLPASLSPLDAARIRRERCWRVGDLDACYDEGRALRDGKGVSRDVRAAVRVFDLVCGADLKRSFGCDEAARLRLNGDLGTIDIAGAVGPLRDACFDRDPRGGSCRRLADLTLLGQGVSQDRGEAMRLYQRACAIKPPQGCHEAGALANVGDDADAAAIAESLFASGCAAGDADSCRAIKLAGLAETLEPIGAQSKIAEAVRTCQETGFGQACFDVAKGAEKDGELVRARRYFDLACSAGFARGCASLGKYAARGMGGATDFDLEVTADTRACVLGLAKYCRAAHARVRAPRASTKATSEASAALADACRAGIAPACAVE
ncbi:MAG: hypothetical protein A2138_16550 [Deltaproteobacteria bacterium RBG_16_71_12]|nr:MAG: hypothetical protein A2138_16550 [Deltaproteobacteria bacterium RBG_16_71_12]